MPRRPVDKSFGATVKVLAIPVLLAAIAGYLLFVSWYGQHRAADMCDHARSARTAGEFRAWLRAGKEPWHEQAITPGGSIILALYPGLGIETIACRVVISNESIREVSVDYHS